MQTNRVIRTVLLDWCEGQLFRELRYKIRMLQKQSRRMHYGLDTVLSYAHKEVVAAALNMLRQGKHSVPADRGLLKSESIDNAGAGLPNVSEGIGPGFGHILPPILLRPLCDRVGQVLLKQLRDGLQTILGAGEIFKQQIRNGVMHVDLDGDAEEGQAIQDDVLCRSLFHARQIESLVCERMRECKDDGQIIQDQEHAVSEPGASMLCAILEPIVLPAYLTKVETNLQSIIIGILERQRHDNESVFERVAEFQPMEEGRFLVLTMRACVDEVSVMSKGELVVQVCYTFKRKLGTLFGNNSYFDEVLADTRNGKVITTISCTAKYCCEHIEAISSKLAEAVAPKFQDKINMKKEIEAMGNIVKQCEEKILDLLMQKGADFIGQLLWCVCDNDTENSLGDEAELRDRRETIYAEIKHLAFAVEEKFFQRSNKAFLRAFCQEAKLAFSFCHRSILRQSQLLIELISLEAELLQLPQSNLREEADDRAAVCSLGSTNYLTDVSLLFFDLQTTVVKKMWMPQPTEADSSRNLRGSTWLSVIADASGSEIKTAISRGVR